MLPTVSSFSLSRVPRQIFFDPARLVRDLQSRAGSERMRKKRESERELRHRANGTLLLQ